MKRFHGALAAIAALALATGVAMACDGEKTAQTAAAEKSCTSTASVKTVGMTSSCSAKASAMTASSCRSMKSAGLTASACCAAKTGLTAKACATTHVVYRVGETDTFDRNEAMVMAEAQGAPVQFVAAGSTYPDENAAKMAMTQAIYARLDEMLTVATTVGGESYACGVSAAKTAEKTGAPMHFVVASHEFDSKEAADSYLARVRAAVDAIKLLDAEGKTVEGCAVSHCKTTGKTAFVLGGQTIECPVTANYMAAQAKMAAVASTDDA